MRYILLSTALLFSFITLRVYSEVVPDDSTIAANEEESDGGVESNDDADNLKVRTINITGTVRLHIYLHQNCVNVMHNRTNKNMR